MIMPQIELTKCNISQVKNATFMQTIKLPTVSSVGGALHYIVEGSQSGFKPQLGHHSGN